MYRRRFPRWGRTFLSGFRMHRIHIPAHVRIYPYTLSRGSVHRIPALNVKAGSLLLPAFAVYERLFKILIVVKIIK